MNESKGNQSKNISSNQNPETEDVTNNCVHLPETSHLLQQLFVLYTTITEL